MMFETRFALMASVLTASLGVGGSAALANPTPLPDVLTVAHEHGASHAEPEANSMPDAESSSHESNHDHQTHDHGQHDHGQMEVDGATVPTVDLVIHPDALRGWNLEIQTTNFAFAPEEVNESTIATEGHAHLFINGEKITRLYGNWYYLNPLPPGDYEVNVVLNANTHEELVHNGQVIQDIEILQVPPSP